MGDSRRWYTAWRKWTYAINFVLASAGCLYLAVPDLGRVNTLGAHALVLFLLAVAALTAAAAVLLLRTHVAAARVSLDAGIGTALVAAVLLVGQWVEDPRPWRLVLWLVVLTGQGLLVLNMYALGARARYPRALAATIGASGAIALFQLWYAGDYEPRHSDGELSLSTTLERGVDRDGFVTLLGTITAENHSTVKVRAPASLYEVVGVRITPRQDDPTNSTFRLRRAVGCEFGATRHYAVDSRAYLGGGRLYDWDTWFEPKSTTTFRFVSYAPAGTYDVAMLKTWVTTAQGRLFQDDVNSYTSWFHEPTPEEPEPYHVESWRLEPGSRLARLLRGDRHVTVTWSNQEGPAGCPEGIVGDEFTGYDVRLTGAPDKVEISSETATRLGRYVKLSTTGANVSLSLWTPPPGPALEP